MTLRSYWGILYTMTYSFDEPIFRCCLQCKHSFPFTEEYFPNNPNGIIAGRSGRCYACHGSLTGTVNAEPTMALQQFQILLANGSLSKPKKRRGRPPGRKATV